MSVHESGVADPSRAGACIWYLGGVKHGPNMHEVQVPRGGEFRVTNECHSKP